MKRLITFLLFLFVIASCTSSKATLPAASPNSDSAVESQQLSTHSIGTNASASPESKSFVFNLTSPQDGTEVTTPTIDLIGTVTKDTVLTVNDDIYLLKAGQFKQTVSLEVGTNVLEIAASDYDGNEVDLVLTILYEPDTE